MIFALARDGQLPAPGWLGTLSGKDSLPRNAIGASALAAAVLLLLALSKDAYATLISMATVGFYISFAFPVFSTLRSRLRGGLTTGAWNAGRFGFAVNVAAAVWLAFEIVNIAWPRLPDAPWYVNYGAALIVLIIALGGLVTRGAMRAKSAARPTGVPEGAVEKAA